MGGVFTKFYKSLPDADDVFAYDTVKEVKVLDRRLGIVYYVTLFIIFVYVVLYVFMIKRQYLDFEKSTGWIIAAVSNPTFSEDGFPWDIYDSVTNPGEAGAVFIPTRIMVTKAQTEGYCPSPLHKCSDDEDCQVGNDVLSKECVDGFCKRFQWCPPESTQESETTKEYLIDAERFKISLKTYVHFHKFSASGESVDIQTTKETEMIDYPASQPNTYPMHDLLRMANVKLKDIQQNGCMMFLNALYRCDLYTEKCSPKVEVSTIDATTGYTYPNAHYYTQDGTRMRDFYRHYGIRFAAFATGIGEKPSFAMTVLQISSAIALLACASFAGDAALQYIVPERRHYIQQKIIETEDFNDD
mmetsp:Transcript_29701/g.76189  ORF Transcript_29701/g.76189 Transcript_29701/m.76189 type:complete len:357 (-) Transcript_29701:67-1137(-)